MRIGRMDAKAIGCRDDNIKRRERFVKDLICYCFEYAVEDINQDFLANGKSTILEKIQMEKKVGNCRCATKNPTGK